LKLLNLARASYALATLAIAVPREAAADPPPQNAAPSASEPSFTVDAALAAMRRSHPLLRAAVSSIRVAEGNAITAGHWTNPLLDVSYFQAVRNSSYDPLGTPNVGVTQFLEFAGAPASRRRSAEAEVRATQAERELVARDLEWAVREAFARLAVSHAKQKIYRDAVTDLERATRIVGARVGTGMAPRYDASRIQIALEQAHADLGDAEAETLRARGDLNVAVGPAAADLAGSPRFDALDVAAPPPLAASLDAARRRPDVVAARHRVDVASSDIEVARRSVFPGIAVRIGAGYGQSTGQLDFGAGLVIPLPLLERGQGTVVAAEARAEGTRHVAEALGAAIVQRIQASHAEYARRVEVFGRFRAQAGTLGDTMRGEAESGYREARLSVLELVDAYHSLRDARLRLLALAESAHLARVALQRAVGAPERQQ
jgi:cobalt-zinc-cadmium efflux system outer membrane protein